jgi:hypothetical protein
MQKTISIFYSLGGHDSFCVSVNYHINTNEDDHITSILCSIEDTPVTVKPAWLRIKKFEAKARLHKGYYTMLYNDSVYAYDLDTNLFTEKATEQIMKHEKMRKLM